MARNRSSRRARWTKVGIRVALIGGLSMCLLLVFLSVRPTPVSRSRPVVLMTGDWSPYVGADLPDGGPLTKMAAMALRQQGLEPDVRFSSWSVAEETAARGEAMGFFPMVGSNERSRDFVWSDPLAEFQYVLFYDRDRLAETPTAVGDLAELRVAHIAGYDYWPELENAVGSFIEFPTSTAAFDALAAGEIDLVPEGMLPGNAILQSAGFGQDATSFDHLPATDPAFASTESLYLMVPKDSDYAALIPSFNRALSDVVKTPEYLDLAASLSPTGAPDEVHLDSFRGAGLTSLLDTDGSVIGATPRATRAVVLRWPESGSTRGMGMVEVKILNGPFVGRVVRVDARDVVLGGAERR